MTGEPTHTTLVERMVPGLLFSSECPPQLSITEIPRSGHYVSFSAVFSPLHSLTNEEHYEKDLCSQSSHNENSDNFVGKSSHTVLPRINTLHCQQK